MEDNNSIIFYTDGAYSPKNNQGGWALYCPQYRLRICCNETNTTNNRMEMKAVILSLNSIKQKVNSIKIVSDSQYVIGCATKGWKRKKNVDLWEEYDKAFKYASQYCSDITFEWVHGHNGDKYNEIVDQLAVKASQEL